MSNIIKFVPRDETIIRRAEIAWVKDMIRRGHADPVHSAHFAQFRQTLMITLKNKAPVDSDAERG